MNKAQVKAMTASQQIGIRAAAAVRAVVACGIRHDYGFDPKRLKEQAPKIRALLEELPPKFKEGTSFLEACYDKHGRQWGEHTDMEMLFCLGMAAGMVRNLMPRSLWQLLPGEMPYYLVLPSE